MKYLPFFLLLFFIGCKEETVPTNPLSTDFDLVYKADGEGKLTVSMNFKPEVVFFKLDFGNGETSSDSVRKSQSASKLFYSRSTTYFENKEYTITLETFDAMGNSAVSSKQITASNTPPKTVADFEYEIRDNGVVVFKSTSLNANAIGTWEIPYFNQYTNRDYYTEQNTFQCKFEKNGTYEVTLNVNNDGLVKPWLTTYDTKVKQIVISNASVPIKPFMQGQFLDKSNDNHTSSVNNNDLYFPPRGTEFPDERYSDWELFVSLVDCFPRVKVYGGGVSLQLYNFTDMLDPSFDEFHNPTLYPIKERYEMMKKLLTPGIKEIGTRQNLGTWNALIKTDSFGNFANALALHEAKSATLEILETQAVTEAKLFPEAYETYFWVTFKLKADFGEKGKVDGTFKVRYLVY